MGRHTGFFCVVIMTAGALLAAGQRTFSSSLVNSSTKSEPRQDLSTFAETSNVRLINRVERKFVPADSWLLTISLDRRGISHSFCLETMRVDACEQGAISAAERAAPVDVSEMRCKLPDHDSSRFWDSPASNESTDSDVSRNAGIPDSSRRFAVPVFQANTTTMVVEEAALVRASSGSCIYFVNRHLQSPENSQMHSVIESVGRLLDEPLRQIVEHDLGPIHDLDHNGRLTVVMTDLEPGVNSDCHTIPIYGCVRQGDFDVSERSDFTGDIIYLDVNLPEGKDLASLLVHELSHAAVYCRLLDRSQHGVGPLAVPEWLHEGIAHVMEARIAPNSTTAVKRQSAFRRAPHLSPVIASSTSLPRHLRRSGARAAATQFLLYAESRRNQIAVPFAELLTQHEPGQEREFVIPWICFEEALVEWALMESAVIIDAGHEPEIISSPVQTQTIYGTAFSLLRSPPYDTSVRVSCDDASEFRVLLLR